MKCCLKIYRIALKQEKGTTDIDREDAIDSNRISFDFMLRMFDHLNQLYEMKQIFLFMQS